MKSKGKRKGFRVDCNVCGKKFFPELKEESHGDGVKQFFDCPNPKCMKRYNIAKITAKGLEIREKIQKELNGKANRAKVEGLQKELKAEVKRL